MGISARKEISGNLGLAKPGPMEPADSGDVCVCVTEFGRQREMHLCSGPGFGQGSFPSALPGDGCDIVDVRETL
jgi:hypothetical protein